MLEADAQKGRRRSGRPSAHLDHRSDPLGRDELVPTALAELEFDDLVGREVDVISADGVHVGPTVRTDG